MYIACCQLLICQADVGAAGALALAIPKEEIIEDADTLIAKYGGAICPGT